MSKHIIKKIRKVMNKFLDIIAHIIVKIADLGVILGFCSIALWLCYNYVPIRWFFGIIFALLIVDWADKRTCPRDKL